MLERREYVLERREYVLERREYVLERRELHATQRAGRRRTCPAPSDSLQSSAT